MSEITWQEPPGSKRGSGSDLKPIAEALRDRPGEWAKMPNPYSSPSTMTAIKNGVGTWQPKGAFDATSRKRPDGKLDIYVRYVGEVVTTMTDHALQAAAKSELKLADAES